MRLGAVIAEGVFFDVDFEVRFSFGGFLLCFGVEITDEHGAVVLLDGIHDDGWEFGLAGHFDTFGDVAFDYKSAHGGVDILVWVIDFVLVFGVVFGFGHFTDIVVEGAGSTDESVSSDFDRGFFGEVGDH